MAMRAILTFPAKVLACLWGLAAAAVAQGPGGPSMEEILDRVTLAWPEGSVAYFRVDVADAEGNSVAEGRVELSHDIRVLEYLAPSRFEGDILYVDGERLHLDIRTGHERLWTAVHRELQDRPLFWIGAVAFHEMAETHREVSRTLGEDGTLVLTLDETADHVLFDKVTVQVGQHPDSPVEVRMHDAEAETYWDLTYRFGKPVLHDGKELPFPARIAVRSEDGAANYDLTIHDVEVGAPSHIHRGIFHGHE